LQASGIRLTIETMGLHKAIRAGIVWLTAAMTLATAFPQFACACPGGRGQTIPVVAEALSANSCPCGGSCCTRSSGSVARKSCCLEAKGKKDRRNSPTQPEKEPLCKKTLTPGQAFVRSTLGKAVGMDDTPFLGVVTLPVLAAFSLSAPHHALHWQLPAHAAPPSLLALFQRLLI